jgi:AP-1-like factor
MSGRRKLSNGNPDESRLLKRKEQNRAAQRAFRERKEKHVKDLEDKVAALEAKNELANSENVNLRDLLARLQDENISLKQAAFTFSVSKTAGSDQPVASGSGHSSLNLTNSPTAMVSAPMSSFSVAPTVSSSDALVSPQIMDWTSLTTFDPAVLNLLDDTLPQTTATDSAMNMDFGFGGQSNKSPFTTIAANPMLMSFADFDSSPDLSGSDNSIGSFNFDMWTNSPQPDAATTMGEPGLDELFGGNYLNKPSPVDFNSFMHGNSPLSTSPIPHPSPGAGDSRSSTSSTSNNSESQSPVSSVGTSVESERVHGSCPRSRDETLKLIESQGQSPFVTEPNLSRRDPVLEKIVPCDGSGLPKTEPRADNVEVLAAWHDLTTNYKDYDINELCSEFTKKARCDGSRVVLEHPSYQDILAKLEQSQRQ